LIVWEKSQYNRCYSGLCKSLTIC